MGFFEVEVNDVLTANPFTITFADFNGGIAISQYVTFQLDYISIVSICNPNPIGSIIVDTNYANSTKKINNTNNSQITIVNLVEVKDIYSYWITNSKDQDIDEVNLPVGTSSLIITLRDTLTGLAINVPNQFNRIHIRFHIIGV